jgi:hypothetical protein
LDYNFRSIIIIVKLLIYKHLSISVTFCPNLFDFKKAFHFISAPTRINSRKKSQFELNCFFENAIRVEYELIQIAKNSIRIHSNGIRIDSNEITKNSKNSFFKLNKKYYTKTSIILTVLINCSRISLKSTGFSDNSIIIEYLSIWKNPNNTHSLR